MGPKSRWSPARCWRFPRVSGDRPYQGRPHDFKGLVPPREPGQASFTRTFWMSMPSETRHVPRIQAVWDLVRQTVQAQRAVLVPPEFDFPGR